MITLWSYVAYLTLSLAMTVWVARTLQRHGALFLVSACGGDEKMAASVNHLLVVGFYLVNAGFVLLALRSGIRPDSAVEAMEFVSVKLGWVLLILGAMHFFNLFVLSRVRGAGNREAARAAEIRRAD